MFETESTKKNTSKVYDCFPFFNEFELLEIRLNELNQVVDKFVLVEATKTHQGKEKPLFYDKNKDSFKKFRDKIIHIVVDFPNDDILDIFNIIYSLNEDLTPAQKITESMTLMALSSFSNYFLKIITSQNRAERLAWKREHYQRNMIMSSLSCNSDDVIIISDMDEIPKADKILAYKDKPGIKIFKQRLYYFYLNYENRININANCNGASAIWNGSIMTHYKNMTTPQALRVLINTPYPLPTQFNSINFIENGGWHFSSIGGMARFKNKIESFSHIENYNKSEEIYEYQKKGILYYNGTQLVCVPIDDSFPMYIRNNLDKFSHLICKNYY
ncbi:MAG: hypothetical protein ACYCSQ_01205 [bacterium]